MRSRRVSRVAALGASVLLTATLVQVASSGVASADIGPSVPLPKIDPVAVTAQAMGPTGKDDASERALSGDQQPKDALEGSGSTTATSLSPSSTWDVSAHTGDFTWSYPLRVPPAAGGLEPNLALSYRSSEVDGRTSATNNQPSWIGDGWALSPGFVERAYGACAEDDGNVTPPQVGDLCWRSDNAVASYDGGGGMLICCDAQKRWRAKADDGSRIERLVGAPNGDEGTDHRDSGEHWKITTVDGTEYWFGSQTDSRSTWTVPVFGDDSGEPCNRGSFDNSHCQQAWRWNLDKVVDRNGNIIRYFYEPESNKYGLNLKDTAVSYVRGGTLSRIDYGLRDNVSTASGRVIFTPADRCVRQSDCSQDRNWPDTNLENKCETATCKDRYSPTFWSTKRLSSITTQVWNGTTHINVDRWDLEQEFPDPGDEKAALWLKGIKHTGLVGGEKSVPAVTFIGNVYPNRLAIPGDGLAPLNRFRITGVVSESGGWTSVSYSSECLPGGPKPDMGNLRENTLRCFPVRWNKKNHEPRTDLFHKYVVSSVTRSDRMAAANTQMTTSYEYPDGAAWHWDTSEFVKDAKKTWNEFRGYGRVRIRTGAANDPAGKVTMTEQRFYRGMNGDRGSTQERKVFDSNNVGYTDHDWLAGSGLESGTFEREVPLGQPNPPHIAKTITKPTWTGPTASRGEYQAYIVSKVTETGYVALPGNRWRTTETTTTYDDRGLHTEVDDFGDIATADDDRCTTTTYSRNEPKWLLNLAGRVVTESVQCKQTAVFPTDALADTATSFDGNGNVTKVEVAKERPAAAPVYITASTTDYDAHGRPTAVTNALGHTTRTAYTPALGGPLTQTVTTSPPTAAVPAGLVTTTVLDPAWGAPATITDPNERITEVAHDPLGRTVAAWLPNRLRGSNRTVPSVAYEYQINKDAATAVKTTKVGPTGATITSTVIFDGFLRARQSQTPAVGGGRLLTDTRYDSQGRVWKTTQPYFNDADVNTELRVASDTEIPGHTRAHYDDAGRQDASIYYAGAHEKWRTTTSYGGDHTTVVPPDGGTATTTYVDARGQTTELRQYTTPATSDSFDKTTYTYTKAGKLASITGPDGAIWRYGYDLLGRQTSVEDPDSGATSKTYDNLSQVTTTKDAVNNTIAVTYDALGRKTGTVLEKDGTRIPLTALTYDTVPNGKGQPATTTRWVAGHAYTSTVLAYDALYQPTQTSMSIPAVEGLLAKTYVFGAAYNPDGSLASEVYPQAGELPEEEISYGYHHLGPINTSHGGYDGQTFWHVTNTDYTRYGELARLQLGPVTFDPENPRPDPTSRRAWLSYYYETHTRRLNRSIVDAEVPAPMQADRRYTYTNAGAITALGDAHASDVQCFRYDQLVRLTDAWTPAWSENPDCTNVPTTANALAGPGPYWHSYTYDKGGSRRTEVQHATAGDTTRTYNYDVSGHKHALSSVESKGAVNTREDFSYTPAGQLRIRAHAGTKQEFTWDAEGHVATVTENGKTTSFLYDATGARLIRREPDATTLYLGKQELRLNHSGGDPTVTRYYTHGGHTVAMRQGTGALTWLASDHQATTQFAVNSTTGATTQRRQLPFGGPRGSLVDFPGERGFVGGTIDSSTRLTHLGAREYDTALGRFISVDPLLETTNPQQMNGYTYASNNPITKSDPTGLREEWNDPICPPGGCNQHHNRPSPPPRAEPKISARDQQVWRSERGSQATTVKKPQSKPVPASNAWGCETYPGTESMVCNGPGIEGPSETSKQIGYAVFDLCGLIRGVGIVCDFYGTLVKVNNGDADPLDFLPFGPTPKTASKGANKACSFSGDTKVLMADGSTKPISEIKVGDKVLAADPETGKKGARNVSAVLAHEDTVQGLAIEGGAKVTTTEDHRFWNATDKQWQRADHLDRGDQLFTAVGDSARVVGLLPASEYVTAAYNLTVEDIHTFYVLADGRSLLVHNDCQHGGIDLSGAATHKGRFPLVGGPADGHLVRRDANGNITNYAVYDANGNILQRVDLTGRAHDSGNGPVPTPHVQPYVHDEAPNGNVYPRQVGVSPATPSDMPCRICRP